MKHVNHIITHKTTLDLRWQILRSVREFFWAQGFIEVETPNLLYLPGQEPYLSPMQLTVHNETGEEYVGYLHTSPEYTLKKMLAAGYEKIFSLGKVFRDYESFGGTHNPEFTLIEWYRSNANFYALMADVENLVTSLHQTYALDKQPLKTERLSMCELWLHTIQIDLDQYLTTEALYELCVKRGYAPAQTEPYEDLFFRIFLNEVEPRIPKDQLTIIYHYPAQMAALSRLSDVDPRYAERFEVYIGGNELANAFGELTDPAEQQHRLEVEQQMRAKSGKPVFAIDTEFVAAVGAMPPSAGIALGIDRLVQAILACKHIDSVIVLPASKLFS